MKYMYQSVSPLIKLAAEGMFDEGFLTLIKEGESYSFGMVVMIPLYVFHKSGGDDIKIPKLIVKSSLREYSIEYPDVWVEKFKVGFNNSPMITPISNVIDPCEWLCIGLPGSVDKICPYVKAELIVKQMYNGNLDSLNYSKVPYLHYSRVAFELGVLKEFIECTTKKTWCLPKCDKTFINKIYCFEEGIAFVHYVLIPTSICPVRGQMYDTEGLSSGLLYHHVSLDPIREMNKEELKYITEEVSVSIDVNYSLDNFGDLKA